jgi:ubiquinone/menaquinone biosynthesis C-methylase UbiE
VTLAARKVNGCATIRRVTKQYAWSNTERERDRLARQGEQLRPATEKLFRAAGIGPGARVLDCGSGGGDVSIIAAEFVTPSGEVLGIERDPNNVEAANRRVADLGLSHVRFETGDIAVPPPGPFDAIVGRLVLMYQSDVEAVLRALADRLVAGGVMAFLEFEHMSSAGVMMSPPSPAIDQLSRWMTAGFHATGVPERVASRLPSLLRAVGLIPQPPYELSGLVYHGGDVVEHVSTLLRGLSGVLTANGIASEDELDIDAFAERVRVECGLDPVLMVSPNLAVWAKKP